MSLSGKLQLYSLAVLTEKANLTTAKIVMTVPNGFGIDSFAAPPSGSTQQVSQSGSGAGGAIIKVTWTGGHTPTRQDSLFQFLGQPASAGSYSFEIEQTYSDGSIVNWAGPESSANPTASIQTFSSFGGGGTSTLTIVALVIGVLGLAAGGFALVGGTRGRPLA